MHTEDEIGVVFTVVVSSAIWLQLTNVASWTHSVPALYREVHERSQLLRFKRFIAGFGETI